MNKINLIIENVYKNEKCKKKTNEIEKVQFDKYAQFGKRLNEVRVFFSAGSFALYSWVAEKSAAIEIHF